MSIWAIADLHLSFSVPDKSMDVFGPEWINYTTQVERNWNLSVQQDDLVLIAGDISWAKHLNDALVDLEWIASLPGTKLLIKGNHDYWWSSSKKLSSSLPPSLHFIHNNAFHWNDATFAGARMWDTSEFNFKDYIDIKPNPKQKKIESDSVDHEKIFEREFMRLKTSLEQMDPDAKYRICLTHYPPLSADLQDSRVSALLEKHRVTHCIFGHLHSLKKGVQMFGIKNHIQYILTSADYIKFNPVKVI